MAGGGTETNLKHRKKQFKPGVRATETLLNWIIVWRGSKLRKSTTADGLPPIFHIRSISLDDNSGIFKKRIVKLM
jgi:hypothetical protein